jgi:putative copper resistance protein D
VLQVARIADLPWELAIRSEALPAVMLDTGFGRDWLLRLGLAALLAPLLAVRWNDASAIRRVLACALALGFSGSLAWAGHAAGTPGLLGTAHLVSDVVHLAAAASWLGALLPLALLLGAAQRCGDASCFAIARCAVVRFSTLGIASVGALVVTGVINACVLVGSLDVLTGSSYGRLLMGKIAVFLAMLAAAAINRLWLTPQLDGDQAAPRGWRALAGIRRNTVAEAAAGAFIIVMVSALGMMAPALDDGP